MYICIDIPYIFKVQVFSANIDYVPSCTHSNNHLIMDIPQVKSLIANDEETLSPCLSRKTNVCAFTHIHTYIYPTNVSVYHNVACTCEVTVEGLKE